MFLLYALVVGIALGLLFGGKISRLGELEIRWAWLAVGGLLVQIALFAPGIGGAVGPAAPAVYIASTVAVFAFVLRNVMIPGFAIVAFGAACNLVAIVTNGGYMPASPAAVAAIGLAPEKGYSNSRVVADPAFAPLTDLFALPRWLPFTNIFSVGDVLIAVGITVAIVFAMRGRVRPLLPLVRPVPGGNSPK